MIRRLTAKVAARWRRFRAELADAWTTDDPNLDGPGSFDSHYRDACRDPDDDRVLTWLEVMNRQRTAEAERQAEAEQHRPIELFSGPEWDAMSGVRRRRAARCCDRCDPQ